MYSPLKSNSELRKAFRRAIGLQMKNAMQQNMSVYDCAWRDLGTSCEAAIDLSETVGQQLSRNAPTSEVVTLLERQLQLATAIREHISRVSEAVGTAGEQVVDSSVQADGESSSGADKDNVAERLRTLLTLEDRNRRLLSSSGVKLCGPSRKRGQSHLRRTS
jgi:hypothetical protein